MIRNKKCIEGTLSFFISLICFAFVSWQSGKCISKYIQEPQGTKLSLENTANHQQFPATGCSIWIGTKVNHYYEHVFRAGNLLFQIYGPKMRTFIFLGKKSTKMDFGFWPIFLKNRCGGVL